MEEEVKEDTIETEELENFHPKPLAEIFGETSPNNGASKPEETPSEDIPEVEKPEKPEEAEGEAEEEQVGTPEEGPEGEPEIDYKAEAEKYKKEAENNLKRYKDTQASYTQARQKLVEAGLEDEDPELTEQEQREAYAFEERERVSKAFAIEKYGEEEVNKMLYNDDAEFKKHLDDPLIIYRVRNSDTPVTEAIKVLKEEKFFDKYGRDVDAIPGKIRKEVESELREKITKEIKSKLSEKGKLPKTLKGLNGVEVEQKKGTYRPKTASQLFG